MTATKTARVILTNEFHNTSAVVLKSSEEIDRILTTFDRTPAEKAWVRRVHDRLCGSSECRCGNELGERGPRR